MLCMASSCEVPIFLMLFFSDLITIKFLLIMGVLISRIRQANRLPEEVMWLHWSTMIVMWPLRIKHNNSLDNGLMVKTSEIVIKIQWIKCTLSLPKNDTLGELLLIKPFGQLFPSIFGLKYVLNSFLQLLSIYNQDFDEKFGRICSWGFECLPCRMKSPWSKNWWNQILMFSSYFGSYFPYSIII